MDNKALFGAACFVGGAAIAYAYNKTNSGIKRLNAQGNPYDGAGRAATIVVHNGHVYVSGQVSHHHAHPPHNLQSPNRVHVAITPSQLAAPQLTLAMRQVGWKDKPGGDIDPTIEAPTSHSRPTVPEHFNLAFVAGADEEDARED